MRVEAFFITPRKEVRRGPLLLSRLSPNAGQVNPQDKPGDHPVDEPTETAGGHRSSLTVFRFPQDRGAGV